MRSIYVPTLLTLASLASGAWAHISLDAPPSRYFDPSTQVSLQDSAHLKNAPCGAVGSTRATDPALITTFQPGQTITVHWHETVAHPGFFRIAFSADGTTFPAASVTPQTVAPPLLVDGIAKISGQTSYTYDVTLPNVTCDQCAIQVLQFMSDHYAAMDNSYFYYQCADLILAASEGGSGGAAGNGGAKGGGGVTSSGGSTNDASGGGKGGAAGNGATGATETATGGTAATGPNDMGSCSCHVPTRGSRSLGLPAIALAAMAMCARRLRRRAQRSRHVN